MSKGAGTGIGSVLGGGAGFVLSGGNPMGAALGAGLGGQLGAGMDSAAAMSDMAAANLAQQQQDRTLAMMYAGPSEMELQQLEQAVATNKIDLARREKILASADPALIEAGTQALKLMRGEDASTLSPVRNQRAQQRKELEAKLQKQLGSGYATSTAGIQALNQFDNQTADLINQTQNATLNQMMGYSMTGAANNSLSQGINQSLQIAGQRGNINARQANAITGNRIDAGSAFAGDLYRSQQNQQLFGNLANIGMIGASGGFGKTSGAGGPADPMAGYAGTRERTFGAMTGQSYGNYGATA